MFDVRYADGFRRVATSAGMSADFIEPSGSLLTQAIFQVPVAMRSPLLVISPHTRGGRVAHTYYDHVSILKFIERNWGLRPLSSRSRDNLPNPIAREDDPYVPRNMPAIGDLVDLFDRDSDGDSHHDRD